MSTVIENFKTYVMTHIHRLCQNKSEISQVSPIISFPAINSKICWNTNGCITLIVKRTTI